MLTFVHINNSAETKSCTSLLNHISIRRAANNTLNIVDEKLKLK